ncbi:MAG: prepilin-type N-terminal cleavage/methylation domain-containing protein [Terriglobia bacterium]
MKRTAKGFSLIELLIVVAIILIIAAIAIPNLLRSRIAANQASAVGSLKAIDTAEVAYTTTYNIGFSAHLGDLGGTCSGTTNPTATGACLIDQTLAGAAGGDTSTKSGYTMTYAAGTIVGTQIPTYTVTAAPESLGQTGQNGYFTDQSVVIRFNTAGAATASDSPIGG